MKGTKTVLRFLFVAAALGFFLLGSQTMEADRFHTANLSNRYNPLFISASAVNGLTQASGITLEDNFNRSGSSSLDSLWTKANEVTSRLILCSGFETRSELIELNRRTLTAFHTDRSQETQAFSVGTLVEQRGQNSEFPGGPGFIIGQTFIFSSPALITSISTLLRTGFAACPGTVRMSIWRLNSFTGDVTQGATLIATSSNAVSPSTLSFQSFTFHFSNPVFAQSSAYYFWGIYPPNQDCIGPSVGANSVDQVAGNAWRLFGNIQDPDTFATLTDLSLYQNLPIVVGIADFYEIISGEFQKPLFTHLQQLGSNTTTSLEEAEITPESTLLFRARIFSPLGNQVQLQVELRSASELFDSPSSPLPPNSDGGILQSNFVVSGDEVTITRPGLVAGPYHWQARVVDNQGKASDWQEFEQLGNVDVIVGTLVPFSNPILVEHTQGGDHISSGPSVVLGQTFVPPTQGVIVNIDTKLLTGFASCPGGVRMGLWQLNSASGDVSEGGVLLAQSLNTVDVGSPPQVFQFHFDRVPVDNAHYYYWGLFTTDPSCNFAIVAERGNSVLGSGWQIGLTPDSEGFSTLTNATIYNDQMLETGVDFYEVIRAESSTAEPLISDLAISINGSSNPVITGSNITYTITLTNNGPNTATPVVVTNTTSPPVTILACSSTGSGVCNGNGNFRQVTFASLPPGASETITINGLISCSLPDETVISNTAEIRSETPDLNPSNNSATMVITSSNPSPSLICPANTTVTTANTCETRIVVNYLAPIISDNCTGLTATCLPPSGSTFSTGTTSVTCTATDLGGATTNCAFTITVNKLVDPSLADEYTRLISEDDTALAHRTPLILIHGIDGNQQSNGRDDISNPNRSYFGNFLCYFNSDSFKAKYKIYRFHYVSDKYSISSIAKAMRNDIDDLICDDQDFDKQFVIIAHSMGGLIARNYMNLYSHNAGIYAGLLGGERVIKLITLATPHHGTIGANEQSRDELATNTRWQRVLDILSVFYWAEDTIAGIPISTRAYDEPNRDDLLWDNFDHIANPNNPDINLRLCILNILENYHSKIIAYYGYINPYDRNDFIKANLISDIGPGRLLREAFKFHRAHDNHGKLLVANVAMDYGLQHLYKFNDGLVPRESAAFNGFTISKQVECPGFDHLDMKDSGAKVCADGQTLFEHISEDIGITPYDGWLQDENNPQQVLFFNSLTGEYKYVQCERIILAGRASVRQTGCSIELQDINLRSKVTIEFSKCERKGQASIFVAPISRPIRIVDHNTIDNTCPCQ